MQKFAFNTRTDKQYRAYFMAVMGSERARHTYQRRLVTVKRLANGFQGKRILDIGCGYGFRTIGIAKGESDLVIGIDMDEDRVNDALNYANRLDLKNVEFKVMNAESLEFASNSFDIVLADEMIHHADNLQTVISEMYRVTKQGGVTVISDHNKWSFPSEIMRFFYFGRNREKVFSARQIYRLFKTTYFRDIEYKHIIFTLPFNNMPNSFLKINSVLESLIELTPFLRSQCAVYVIRGTK